MPRAREFNNRGCGIAFTRARRAGIISINMEPREGMDEPGLQAPCPRCGEQVHIIFKFCPFCGMEMKAVIEETKSDMLPQNKVNSLSTDSQRVLMDFEKQFEELRKKREGKGAKHPALGSTDSNVIKLAIFFGILILLGLIGCWIIFSQFAASMQQVK